MSKTYYKVVSKNLQSAVVSSSYSTLVLPLSVQYKIGDWTEANLKGSNLMVFDSFNAANNFIKHNHYFGPHRIFTCEIEGKTKNGIFYQYFMLSHYVRELKEIAKLRSKRKKFSHMIREHYFVPDGTVFCSRIKLLKEIK